MKSFSRITIPTALLVVFCAPSVRAGESLFPDPALEAAVRQNVFAKRDNTEPLTPEDVANLSQVVARGKGIRSLKGMEHCKRIALLDLADNEISDLSPLAGLNILQSLTVSGNKVRDLAPLSALDKLQYLELSRNQITDIAPLAKLVNMRALYLSQNQIKEIGAVAQMTKLTSLYLDGNQIVDAAPIGAIVRLSSLDLANNQIRDVSFLKSLNSLSRLNLAGNEIASIAPLAEMVREDTQGQQRFAPYWSVDLRRNPLAEAAKTDVATLQKHSPRIEVD